MPLLVVVPPAVRIHRREAALRHGVTAEGLVVGIDHSGDTDYLRVSIGGSCACVVDVATNSLARHPVQRRLPVRYDPSHAGVAEALVDRPSPYAPVLMIVAGLVVAALITIPRVRIEPWRRARSNATLTDLSVYPAGSPPGSRPSCRYLSTNGPSPRCHENLSAVEGHLRLAALTDPARRPTAIRQIVALTQGINKSSRSDSGLRSHRVDGFSAADVTAIKLMSGCGDTTITTLSPSTFPPNSEVMRVPPAAGPVAPAAG